MNKELITTVVVTVLVGVVVSLATQWILSKTKFDNEPANQAATGCGCNG